MEPATATLSDSILPPHGQADEVIAFLATSRPSPSPSAAQDEREGDFQIGAREILRRRIVLDADHPDVRAALNASMVRARFVTRGDLEIMHRAGGCLDDRGRHAHRPPLGDDDAVDADRFRGPQEGAKVLRVLHGIEHQNKCWLAAFARATVSRSSGVHVLEIWNPRDDPLVVLRHAVHFFARGCRASALPHSLPVRQFHSMRRGCGRRGRSGFPQWGDWRVGLPGSRGGRRGSQACAYRNPARRINAS